MSHDSNTQNFFEKKTTFIRSIREQRLDFLSIFINLTIMWYYFRFQQKKNSNKMLSILNDLQ